MYLASGGQGVKGVQVDLVNCSTDTPVARTFSNRKGKYDFDLSSDQVRPGRYYATYRAVRNTRVEGDTLPLDRALKGGGTDGMAMGGMAVVSVIDHPSLSLAHCSNSSSCASLTTRDRNVQIEEDGFDCEPRGGEGKGYVDEAEEKGDLDVGGYCGRSAGCLEVGSKAALGGLYENLEVMGGGSARDLEGEKFVALPREGFWDVEMGEEEWNLR